MSRIFISYRREDTKWMARALKDRLGDAYGHKNIFMDVDSIDFGLDFQEVIEKAVGQVDVVLALIGRNWLSITDNEGRPRIHNPDDFVRLEIAAALKRDIRLIPLLERGVAMPSTDELPQEIQSLARRNALEVADTAFDEDVGRLISSLNRMWEQEAEGSTFIDDEFVHELRTLMKEEPKEHPRKQDTDGGDSRQAQSTRSSIDTPSSQTAPKARGLRLFGFAAVLSVVMLAAFLAYEGVFKKHTPGEKAPGEQPSPEEWLTDFSTIPPYFSIAAPNGGYLGLLELRAHEVTRREEGRDLQVTEMFGLVCRAHDAFAFEAELHSKGNFLFKVRIGQGGNDEYFSSYMWLANYANDPETLVFVERRDQATPFRLQIVNSSEPLSVKLHSTVAESFVSPERIPEFGQAPTSLPPTAPAGNAMWELKPLPLVEYRVRGDLHHEQHEYEVAVEGRKETRTRTVSRRRVRFDLKKLPETQTFFLKSWGLQVQELQDGENMLAAAILPIPQTYEPASPTEDPEADVLDLRYSEIISGPYSLDRTALDSQRKLNPEHVDVGVLLAASGTSQLQCSVYIVVTDGKTDQRCTVVFKEGGTRQVEPAPAAPAPVEAPAAPPLAPAPSNET